LEKGAYLPVGGGGTGGLPIGGNTYMTMLAADPQPIPGDGVLTLTEDEVQTFKATRQIVLHLGSLPPGEVHGIFVESLDLQDLQSLTAFRSEFFQQAAGSANWVLRVQPSVSADIAQIVLNHLLEIRLQFAVSANALSDDGLVPANGQPAAPVGSSEPAPTSSPDPTPPPSI
jgi:hypothetical protein